MSSEIVTNVSMKKGSEVVSADVKLYNDVGDVVKKIVIVDSDTLTSLESTIERFEEEYVDLNQLNSLFSNQNQDVEINAKYLNGKQSDFYAKREEVPMVDFDVPPKNHESETVVYGAGSKTRYGHVKLRDNLTAANYNNGEALSSYQGKVLNDKVNNNTEALNTLKSNCEANSLRIKVGRTRDRAGENNARIMVHNGESIYLKVYCDKDISSDFEGKLAYFVINNRAYERTLDRNGEAVLNLNTLSNGAYLLSVVVTGFDNVNCTDCQKIVVVE